MNETIRESAARVAGRWMFGFAFMLPLVAGAAAPSVSITSIQATAQTNYNGSVVTATFTGSLTDYTVKLTVGDTPYTGTVSGDKVKFAVPGTTVTAGQIYAGTITATDNSGTYTLGGKYLYQGEPIAGGGGTNGWFKTCATGTTLNEQGGTWSTPNPPAKDSKIIIDENADGEYVVYTYTPTDAAQGQVTVIDMDLSFDEALDDAPDAADMQAAIRVVTDGGNYRFAALADGVWKTNTTMKAYLGAAYSVRMTIDYHQVPARVTYEVLTNGVYTQIASGFSGTMKSALERLAFNGTGKLTQMTGSNIVDSVDASLVKDGDGKKYANIDQVPAEKRGNLTLLWNTAWTPVATVDGAWTIHGGDKNYQLYINPTGEGVWVKNTSGTWTVRANYYEAANLYFDNNVVTTNKYTYFTNAVAQTDTTITNLYLLQDVALDTKLAVNKTMTFNGEDLILSGSGLDVANGKTFTIAGGCIDVAQSACSGNVVLQGGRYKTTPGWTAPTDYTFADLAVAVRTDYVKQLMLKTKAPTKDSEQLLPMTDANGESVSVVVDKTWAQTKTGTSDAAAQSAALSVVQANGMTRLDNEVLGLAKNGEVTANNIPVITPVQSSTADKVTFSLGNVSPSAITASGAKVSYRVVTSSNPGGKDGAASSYVAPANTVQMDLPANGVKYYLIEVDTGAVK